MKLDGCRASVVLQTVGYRLRYAPGARAALTLLAESELQKLDLMMPNMNGWEFRGAQLDDPRLAKIPVVVLSATGERARPIDAALVLRKPVTLDALLSAVAKSTRKSQ